MSDEDTRVTALEEKVRALEGALAAVTRELEARRVERDSMRARLRCPSCRGRRIYRVKRVLDRDGGQKAPMAVSVRGLFFPEVRGVFECDVCAACGLVEWYVQDPGAIDVEQDDIELIEAEDPAPGPYR